MGRTVLTIMKKECSRIISDRKLFFTAVLLPGILIFVMYSFIGTFMSGMFEADENHIHEIHVVNMPQSVGALLLSSDLGIEIININAADIPRVREDITNRNTDLLLVFPPGFDADVAVFDPLTATAPAPNVEIWRNSARAESREAFELVAGIIHAYHHSLTHRFNINAPTAYAPDGNFDLVTEADIFAMVTGFMIPMLFIIFLFQSCQALAPESISGEKERGTLGTLLVTPASRSQMALGKILGVGIFSLLGGVGAIVGTILAMPNMIVGMDGGISGVLDFFAVSDFLLLLVVALSTTLVFVGMLSVLSAYAKTIKEATAYSMPFMIISMVAGLASTILGGVPTEPYFYFIPVFNSALSLSSVFAFEVSAVNMAITAGVNVLFTLLCTIVLAKIFSSEKIVFS